MDTNGVKTMIVKFLLATSVLFGICVTSKVVHGAQLEQKSVQRKSASIEQNRLSATSIPKNRLDRSYMAETVVKPPYAINPVDHLRSSNKEYVCSLDPQAVIPRQFESNRIPYQRSTLDGCGLPFWSFKM